MNFFGWLPSAYTVDAEKLSYECMNIEMIIIKNNYVRCAQMCRGMVR